LTTLFLFLAAAVVGGCTTGPVTSPSSVQSWVAHQGGITTPDNARQARVDQAAARLLSGRSDLRICVRVLANDCPCAYGWPNGNLFVTRGLVDRVTDDELTAALAHEMGHLLAGGNSHRGDHGNVVVSLHGVNQNLDAEQTADAIGVRLLVRQGLSAEPMVSMLRKVAESGTLSDERRAALEDRIALLEQSSSRTQSRLDTP
jgi:Zn-dependent protease with chaperone function